MENRVVVTRGSWVEEQALVIHAETAMNRAWWAKVVEFSVISAGLFYAGQKAETEIH